MYAYKKVVEDSTEYLQDSSLVNIDLMDRDKADGEQRSVNLLIQLTPRRNVKRIFRVAVFRITKLEICGHRRSDSVEINIRTKVTSQPQACKVFLTFEKPVLSADPLVYISSICFPSVVPHDLLIPESLSLPTKVIAQSGVIFT